MPYKQSGGIYVVESKQQQQQQQQIAAGLTATVIPSAITTDIQYVEMNNMRQQQHKQQQQQKQQQQHKHQQQSSQSHQHGAIITDGISSMQSNRQTNLNTKTNNNFTTTVQQHSVKQQLIHQQLMHTTAHNSQNPLPSHQQLIHVTEDLVPSQTTTSNSNLLLAEGQMIGSQIYKVVDGTFIGVNNSNNGQKIVGNIVLPKPTPKVTGRSNISNTTTAAGQLHSQNPGHQQQTQTINFYSTKNVTYGSPAVSTAPSSAPVITATSLALSTSRQKFSVARPGAGTGSGGVVLNRTSSNQNPQQQQQQQIQPSGVTTYVHQTLTPTSHQKQQMVQKITMPRNMPLITRVMQQPTSTNVGNGSTSTTSDTNHTFLHQQIPQMQHAQLLVQQTHKVSAGTGSPTKNNNNSNAIKKSSIIKHNQGKIATATNVQQQGLKTFIQQQQQQQTQLQQQQLSNQVQQVQYSSAGSGKSKSKVLKQQYGSIANTNGAVSITTLPQHQQKSSTLNAYNTNSYKNSSNQQMTATKITKYSSSPGKYVTINHQQQQQQPQHQSNQHHVNSLPQATQLHQKRISNNSNCLTLQSSQVINNSNGPGSNNNGSGTIKFVNAHGTVVQHHSTAPTQSSVAQQKLLSTAHRQAQQIQQHYQQQTQSLHFGEPAMVVTSETKGNGIIINSGTNTNVYQLSTTNLQQPLVSQQQQQLPHSQQQSPLSQHQLLSQNQQPLSQHQQQPQPQQKPQHQHQQHPQQQIPHQTQQQQQQTHQLPLSQQHQLNKSSLSIPNDVMVVNGEQMTDEVSARILQSMAQKSYNNQQRFQHQNQQKNVSVASIMPPPPPQSIIVQQSHSNVSPGGGTSTLLSPKEYQIYNTSSHQQNHPQTHIATDLQFSSSCNLTSPTSASLVSFAIQNTNTSLTYSSPIKHSQSTASSRSQSMERRSQEMRKSTSVNPNLPSIQCSISSNKSDSSNINNFCQSEVPIDQTSSIQKQHQQSQSQSQPQPQPQKKTVTNSGSSSSSIHGCTASTNDDIIGVEVRPVPVLSQDLRLQQLHAVLQDHTYANAVPTHLPSNMENGAAIIVSQQPPLGPLQTSQQWPITNQSSLPIITPTSNVISPASTTESTPSYTLYGGQQIPRFPQDDETNSAVSIGRPFVIGDIDPGEETETAAEADPEDDSVTRCVCDLTHDDGFMICCDKCSVWQHVDCMFKDRSNIPEDYLCELCQPRAVDKSRARSLQLEKRKEQAQLMALNAQVSTLEKGGPFVGANSGFRNRGEISIDAQQNQRLQEINNSSSPGCDLPLHTLPSLLSSKNKVSQGSVPKKGKAVKKAKVTKSKTKKSEKIARIPIASNVGTSKSTSRKELKKSTKRKTRSSDGNTGSGFTAAEKHTATMRQWIEKYELAMTNHYSPELRARLHGITKQPSLLQSILNTENKILKDCNNLEHRVTTVPYAGSKILVSSGDVEANCPLLELRGKYMLSTQFKQQNPSLHMNTPKPIYLSTTKAHKIPGPFLFFYQLPGAEAPMQTMNPDGTYPPLPPQPVYLQGPEICVDTRTYGSEARFVRRSCRPNAEIQHLFEKGTIHLFIVSITSIRTGNEITIKHESHDLLAVEKRKSLNTIIQPTSTTPCACGGCKSCPFGPPPVLNNLNITNKPSKKSSVMNGSVLSAAVKQLTMTSGSLLDSVMPGGLRTRKKSQTINRNRSTSSSGDSSIGCLNSPKIIPQLNINNSSNSFKGNSNLLNSTMMSALPGSTSGSGSTSSILPDSGICTSSSSTSVSLPSPILSIHSPINHHQQPAIVIQQSTEHQQILAALPTPMLLSPQFQQQQKQYQDSFVQQQSLAVIAAAAATQTPLTISSSTLCPPESILVEHTLSSFEQHQRANSESEVDALNNSAENLAAAALQSLNSSTPLTSSPTQQIKENATTTVEIQDQQCESPAPNSILKVEEKQILLPESIQQQQQQQLLSNSPEGPALLHKIVSPTSNTSERKTPARKLRTISASDEVSNDSKDSSPISIKPQEKKKLSREDRKMEAILRAIEKMERGQRRKEAKQRQNSHNEKGNNSSPISPVKRSETPATSSTIGDNLRGKKNNFGPRKKRRKSQKSYTSVVGQRKRRKSFVNNQEQLVATEMTNTRDGETSSVLSTSAHAISNLDENSYGKSHTDDTCLDDKFSPSILGKNSSFVHDTANVDQAAGLLMALSNPIEVESQGQHDQINSISSLSGPELYSVEEFKSPQRINVETTNASPASVSSACLLVEAAMGPLTNDNAFKCPAKAKTKKSLVSNWLNQTEPLTGENPSPTCGGSQTTFGLGFDSLVQAAMSNYQEHQREEQQQQVQLIENIQKVMPENLSFAAKKVEEFISQNESSNSNIIGMALETPSLLPAEQCNDISFSHTDMLSTTPIGIVSSCTNNSSVKKRWLRQAISEETDEQPITAIAPMVLNGMSTPLKKRLLVINNNEDDEEVSSNGTVNTTPTVQDNSNSEEVDIIGNDFVGNLLNVEAKVHDTDSDVDSTHKEFSNYSQQFVLKTRHPEVKNTTLETGTLQPVLNDEENDKKSLDMTTDQEDDVDILRSPSPGQKMIAEDNLVKILPEDCTGEDNDVRIDVEHEESLAGDKFEEIVNFQRPSEGDGLKIIKLAADGRLILQTSNSNSFEKLSESNTNNRSPELSPTQTPTSSPTRLPSVFINSETETQTKLSPNVMQPEDKDSNSLRIDIGLHKTKGEQQTSLLKINCLSNLTTSTLVKNKPISPNLSSIVYTTLPSAIETNNANTVSEPKLKALTVDDHSCVNLSTEKSSAITDVSSIQPTTFPKTKNRRDDLTDDDIEERLQTFHKENILILQSRNKSLKLSSNKQEATFKSESQNTSPKNLKVPKPLQSKDVEKSLLIPKSLEKQKKKERRISAVQRSTANSIVETPKCKQNLIMTNETTFPKTGVSKSKSADICTLSSSSLKEVPELKMDVVASHSSKETTVAVPASGGTKKRANEFLKDTTTVTSGSKRSKEEKRMLSDDLNTKRSKHYESFDSESYREFLKANSKRKRRNTICESREGPNYQKIKKYATNDTIKNISNSNQSIINNNTISDNIEKGENKLKSDISLTYPLVSTNENYTKTATMSSTSTSMKYQTKVEPTSCNSAQKCVNTATDSTLLLPTSVSPKETFENRRSPESNIHSSTSALHQQQTHQHQQMFPVSTIRENQPFAHINNIETKSTFTKCPSISKSTHSSITSSFTTSTSLSLIPPHISSIPSGVPTSSFLTLQSPMLPPPPHVPHDPSATLANASGLSQTQTATQMANLTVPANNLLYYKTIYGKLREGPTSVSSKCNNQVISALSSSTCTLNENVSSEFLDFKTQNCVGYNNHSTYYTQNSTMLQSSKMSTSELGNNNIESSLPQTSLLIMGNKTVPHFLTTTASKDPRLNPALSAPDPPHTPKRKLSISEYRKRMQQSSDSTTTTTTTTTGTTQSVPDRLPKTGCENVCTISNQAEISKEPQASKNKSSFESRENRCAARSNKGLEIKQFEENGQSSQALHKQIESKVDEVKQDNVLLSKEVADPDYYFKENPPSSTRETSSQL